MTVHPRTCGEQQSSASVIYPSTGSSPHVRGTVEKLMQEFDGWRFIPARAGNSVKISLIRQERAVHPRTCGEQFISMPIDLTKPGSSPHVRGTEPCHQTQGHGYRFIPARAGNRSTPISLYSVGTVHPRTCGEQGEAGIGKTTAAGSSPHVRGTGITYVAEDSKGRFIPARAGNRRLQFISHCQPPVHPRTCGEQLSAPCSVIIRLGSSPHVRGTVIGVFRRTDFNRFIPARAGNRYPY